MNEQLKMTEQLILIAFGAGIGIIPGVLIKVIYDSIKNSQKKKQVLYGYISELKELKFQYLMSIYLIYIRYAMLGREKITFLAESLEEYKDYEEADETLKALRSLNNGSDSELSSLLEVRRSESRGKSLIPKKSKILFIEQNLQYLDMFDESLKYKILKIMRGIDRLNQQIDIARIYDMKTFEIEDSENHKKICVNLDISLQNLGRWQEITVKDITEFIANYEKSCDVVKFN